MEKRLRRARTVAIVLAIVFYLISKLGCVWTEDGDPHMTTEEGAWHLPHALLPTVGHLVYYFIGILGSESVSAENAVRLILQLGGLGLALVFALVAYIANALLRVDAD